MQQKLHASMAAREHCLLVAAVCAGVVPVLWTDDSALAAAVTTLEQRTAVREVALTSQSGEAKSVASQCTATAKMSQQQRGLRRNATTSCPALRLPWRSLFPLKSDWFPSTAIHGADAEMF